MALKINDIATKLYDNALAQEKVRQMLKPLQEAEEALREEMLVALKRNKVGAFRSEESGYTYTRAFRASLGVVDEQKALKWAVKNKCAKVDTTEANKLLKGAGALPEGFEQKETEYLTINKPKETK